MLVISLYIWSKIAKSPVWRVGSILPSKTITIKEVYFSLKTVQNVSYQLKS